MNFAFCSRGAFVIVLFATSLMGRAVVSFSDAQAGLPGLSNASAQWGDYDNDGDLDLILSGFQDGEGYRLDLWRNENGHFTIATAGLPQTEFSRAAWGDYDRDGDLDLALLVQDPVTFQYSTQIWRNDSGVFSKQHSIAIGMFMGHMEWADYDRDGDLDLFFNGPDGPPRQVHVWRNDGVVFTDVPLGINAVNFATGDYDGDGDADLVAKDDDSSLRLWRNDGGTFVEAILPYSLTTISVFAWGDYDNDGDLDLLVAGYAGSKPTGTSLSRILRNDEGTFFELDAGLPATGIGSFTLGDYDNDGVLDVAGVSFDPPGADPHSGLLRNDAGAFVDSGIQFPQWFVSQAAWGDYDGDGDLDLFLSGGGENGSLTQIWRNDSTVANTPPSAPSALNASITGDRVIFSWAAASDAQTPAAGLSYNIRVGTSTGAANIISPEADLSTGLRRLPLLGNVGHSTTSFLALRDLPIGTYYWSVQAVDTALASGPWATEATFIIADTDSDGMPDWWESLHGLDPNSSADASLDSDGDGFTNLQELAAGTDPQSAASAIKIADTATIGADVIVKFFSVAGKLYRLERSLVSPGGPWTTISENIAGAGGEVSVMHSGGSSETRAFYRVIVQP